MEDKTERIYNLINFTENEVLPKLEYIQNQMDELFPELKDIRCMKAFEEKFGAKLKKDEPIGSVLKVLAENIQKHKFISEAYEAKTELLYHLLEKILKGNLKSAIDERALADFISALTKVGYDLSYTPDRITIEKTWAANYKNS
ncbi:hypothetical protein [Cetobacterium sp.]|uniref:hypothetical protein n=1 Tax=Cetobacterium sp. TaxID=2071632 RepID=UPI003F39E070